VIVNFDTCVFVEGCIIDVCVCVYIYIYIYIYVCMYIRFHDKKKKLYDLLQTLVIENPTIEFFMGGHPIFSHSQIFIQSIKIECPSKDLAKEKKKKKIQNIQIFPRIRCVYVCVVP
jgi:hypothetical protein